MLCTVILVTSGFIYAVCTCHRLLTKDYCKLFIYKLVQISAPHSSNPCVVSTNSSFNLPVDENTSPLPTVPSTTLCHSSNTVPEWNALTDDIVSASSLDSF